MYRSLSQQGHIPLAFCTKIAFKLISVKTGRFFTTPKKDVSKTDEFLTYKNSLMFVISNTNKVSFLFVVSL